MYLHKYLVPIACFCKIYRRRLIIVLRFQLLFLSLYNYNVRSTSLLPLSCISILFLKKQHACLWCLIDRLFTPVFRSTTVYGYDTINNNNNLQGTCRNTLIHSNSLSFSLFRTLHSPDIWRSAIEHELLKPHSYFKYFWSGNLAFPCVCFNLVFSRLIAGIEQRKRITFLGSLTTVEIKQLVLYK